MASSIPPTRLGPSSSSMGPELHEGTTWSAWVRALVRGPLRELGALGGSAIAELWHPAELAAIWSDATREIAARTLVACARERLLPAQRDASAIELELVGSRVRFPLVRARVLELDRLDLHTHEPEAAAWLDHPLEIVDCLLERLPDPSQGRTRVRAELLGSIENLASARLARLIRDRLAERLPDDPRLNDPEHFVTDGHPWHPMTRTRAGLGRADVVRHAPELLAKCRLGAVDVDAGLVRVGGDWIDRSDWLGQPPRGWVRIPVHPVQARRLPRLFAGLRGSAIRPVDANALPDARALLSMRTVALPEPMGMHVKLALGVHTTSARRTVSPMSVRNGPPITGLIERIRARDPQVRPLVLMAESASAGLDPDRVGDSASELGAILRTVPKIGGGSEGASAWVCAALGERWPGTDQTLLELACAAEPGDRSQRIRAGLAAWLDLLVPATLRLFVAHGVALEAHLQNSLVVVARGRVQGFWVRDLGGIRLHRGRLREAGHAVELDPRSFTITDDLDEVRGKIEHTLFHAHLAHVFEVADALGVPERESWARLRERVGSLLDRWAGDPDEPQWLRATARSERERLLAARVRAKALFAMRLSERVSDYEYTEVDNPLARG